MTTTNIDRLAAFCRLSERGYRRDPECGVLCEPEWVRDVPGGVEIWRPDESDDDCRVVLEALPFELWERFAETLADIKNCYPMGDNPVKGTSWIEWGEVFSLLLATPAEKCAAVLKVMGDA